MDFEDLDDGYGVTEGKGAARAVRFSRMVNLAAALSSAVLVIGLGIWCYKLVARDVTSIPVIRAIEGPMRIAPQNPGGEIAAHQGLAVNDIAAVGTAAPPPETLILAPRPVELTEEDAAAEDLNGSPSVAPPENPALAPLASAEPETGTNPDAVAKALAEALTIDPDSAVVDEVSTDVSVIKNMAAPDTTSEVVSASIRPRSRPADLPLTAVHAESKVNVASALVKGAGTTPANEVAASMIPLGTRLVQLGAFDSENQARAEWVKLSKHFGAVFGGKALVVQSSESGGRTFYRLRAHGFANETEIRDFCLTLLEQNVPCVPVDQR